MFKCNSNRIVLPVFRLIFTNSSFVKNKTAIIKPERLKSEDLKILENSSAAGNKITDSNEIHNSLFDLPIQRTTVDKSVKWGELFKNKEEFTYKIKNHLPEPTGFKNFIFDLNNVLLSFDKKEVIEIKKELYMILKHPVWYQYLEGGISKSDAYQKISKQTNLSTTLIEQVINRSREILNPIEENVKILKELKSMGKRLIVLSNCPKDEITLMRRRFEFFDDIDVIFATGDIGTKKPDPSSIKFVLNYCNLIPEESVYIDDEPENIETARKYGVNCILYKDKESFKEIQKFSNINEVINYDKTRNEKIVSPYSKNLFSAYNYITKYADLDNCGLFLSIVGLGEKIQNPKKSPSEIFANAVMLLTSKQIALSKIGNEILTFMTKIHIKGIFSFFNYLEVIPYDADTTSTSLALLYKHNLIDENIIHSVLDSIIDNHNDDKVILTYFNKKRYRLCPIVCANVLYLVHLVKRENHEVIEATKKYLLYNLLTGVYVDGCTYYPNPDFFLYVISKLVHHFPQNFSEFRKPLVSELTKRIAATDDTLSLASRVISCKLLDIENERDFNKLISMQLEDGSWPESSIYSTSKKQSGDVYYWANRAFSTMLCMKAVELEIFGKKIFI